MDLRVKRETLPFYSPVLSETTIDTFLTVTFDTRYTGDS
jgi:hypothetical protein